MVLFKYITLLLFVITVTNCENNEEKSLNEVEKEINPKNENIQNDPQFQFPSVQVPNVQLSNVQMPNMKLPSFNTGGKIQTPDFGGVIPSAHLDAGINTNTGGLPSFHLKGGVNTPDFKGHLPSANIDGGINFSKTKTSYNSPVHNIEPLSVKTSSYKVSGPQSTSYSYGSGTGKMQGGEDHSMMFPDELKNEMSKSYQYKSGPGGSYQYKSTMTGGSPSLNMNTGYHGSSSYGSSGSGNLNLGGGSSGSGSLNVGGSSNLGLPSANFNTGINIPGSHGSSGSGSYSIGGIKTPSGNLNVGANIPGSYGSVGSGSGNINVGANIPGSYGSSGSGSYNIGGIKTPSGNLNVGANIPGSYGSSGSGSYNIGLPSGNLNAGVNIPYGGSGSGSYNIGGIKTPTLPSGNMNVGVNIPGSYGSSGSGSYNFGGIKTPSLPSGNLNVGVKIPGSYGSGTYNFGGYMTTPSGEFNAGINIPGSYGSGTYNVGGGIKTPSLPSGNMNVGVHIPGSYGSGNNVIGGVKTPSYPSGINFPQGSGDIPSSELAKDFKFSNVPGGNVLPSFNVNLPSLDHGPSLKSYNCSVNPKDPKNASMRCTKHSATCQASCNPNYQFPNGATSLFITCADGEWSIKGLEWDEIPSCEPICLPPCQNNGICIKPGICACAEKYSGPQCQHDSVCISKPAMPKNSKLRCSQTSCTITCMKGYQFPDGSEVTNLNCNNGQWVPNKAEWAGVPNCQPTCTPACQNGGNCLSYNVCQCPPKFRGPQCQYNVEACAPSKLKFNGAYSCNGTDELFQCAITCPEGVEFEFPPAKVYTCEYARGSYIPSNVPLCAYTDSMEVFDGGSSSQTFYNQSKYGSKGGKTGGGTGGGGVYYYEENEDDYEEEEYTEIKKRYKLRSGKWRKQMGIPYYEFNEETDYGEVQLPGMYSVYASGDVKVLHRTPKAGICSVWNGNKIKTFDGLSFSAPLYCSHTLLQDRLDGSFSVILRACPYGAKETCPYALDVFIQNEKYSFENENGLVKLFTPKKQLPIPAQLSGLRVSMVGNNIQIGLETVQATILWDSHKQISVQATRALWNRTAGLCGTLDNSMENDFLSKTGTILTLPSTFIDEWKSPSVDPACIMEHSEEYKIKECSPAIKIKAANICKTLLKNPKLLSCTKNFEINSLIASCMSDYCNCNYDNKEICACESLTVLAKDCSFQGIALDSGWRNLEVCPMPCKNGRIYNSCGPLFEPSCGSAIEAMIEGCQEGCYCPEGTIQQDGNCVKIENCPCLLRGKLFKAGSQITKDCNTCTCQKGSWKCTDVTCGSRCGAIGDPHYQTFDGKRYDFMGKCSYYLMKTTNFSIEAENVACPGSISAGMGLTPSTSTEMPSCTKSVTIHLEGGEKSHNIKLKQGRQVLVDGFEIAKLPKILQNGLIRIREASSMMIVVEFNDGITVWWDGMTRVYIDAPTTYRGKTKGLCGTFNSNLQDDFLTPEGDIETSIEPFADKWRTKESCEYLSDSPQVPHPCQLNIENKAKAESVCSKLRGKIFEDCHWSVDPEPFYEDCLYDVCACKGDTGPCMCPIFAAYATECARQGVITNWRYSVNECAVKCSPGQIFEQCGDACSRTCEDLQENRVCKSMCVEGCRCPSGQALDSSNECIPIPSCQCMFNNLVFNPGYKEVRPGTKYLELCTCIGANWNCKEALEGDAIKYPAAGNIKNKCRSTDNEEFTTCEPSEIVTCKNMHLSLPQTSMAECRPGCVCKKGYVFDVSQKLCVLPKDCSCHHGGKSYNDGDKIQEDCNTCICQSGKWSCSTIQCATTCTAWGDSHFETYDGKDFDFQGVCNYVLSKGVLHDGEGFSVTLQNVLCGSLGVTCSKSIQIATTGQSPEIITLSADSPIPGQKILNDPIKSIQPKKSSKLLVHRAGIFVIVEAPGLGFQVKWDRGTRVYVKLENKWKGRVQGLCGNYNGDATDDLKTPSGGIETSPTLFGHSWRLQDFCAVPTDPIDACAEHPQRQTWAQRKCGILKSDVFKACHSEVPVEKYLKRCIFDTCACDQGGDCECLCTALAAYAHVCTMKGVLIKWRTPDLCPMQCDPHCSSYSPCISTCPVETCENLLDQGKDQRMCKEDTCVEGCKLKECSDNTIYFNETYSECVPKAVCKPICLEVNGIVYYEGDVMKSDNCQTCHCTRGKEICSGVPCSTTQKPRVMLEEKLNCSSGWSMWMNQDKSDIAEIQPTKTKAPSKGLKNGDLEPVISYLLMKNTNGYAYCSPKYLKSIECRTVGTHMIPKSTGEDVECSLEKGLICIGQCHDYEIRVLCDCGDVTTPKPYTERPKTTTTTTVHATKSPDCIPNAHDEFLGDCHKFLHCTITLTGGWEYVEKICGPGTMFNPTTKVCDWEDSVLKIKPECGLPPSKIMTSSSRPWTRKPTTTTKSVCPPGKIWSDCAIPCKRACHYYGHYLIESGSCTETSDACTPGCVDDDAVLNCPSGFLYRNEDECVAIADCTCMSKLGRTVKPGEVISQGKCKKCFCHDNAYVCTNEDCGIDEEEDEEEEARELGENYDSAKYIVTTKRPNILAITVTPPPKCDPINFVQLIDGDYPLSDQAFTASSTYGSSFEPKYARLNSMPTTQSSGSWSPATNEPNEYLQVEFPKVVPIYGVIVKGSPTFNQYVTSYKILHSYDGATFHYVEDDFKNPEVFRGPIDSRSPVEAIFKHPIEAKVVRILPITWHEAIAIRLDLLGCSYKKVTTAKPSLIYTTMKPFVPSVTTEKPTTKYMEDSIEPMCDDPMGVENGQLAPSQIKVSSIKSFPSKTKSFAPFELLKLNFPKGWKPAIDSPNEYVMFDFLQPRNLTGIKTKGGESGHVTAYNVLYSSDNLVWNNVLDVYREPKLFLANFDEFTPKINFFKYPIQAQYLKIVPIKWQGAIEMKVEPLGCFVKYPPIVKTVTTTTPTPLEEMPGCGTCKNVLVAKMPVAGTCKCYEPLYWNGQGCVQKSECPCMVGYIPYNVGTQFEKDDCSQCTCLPGGREECKPKQCLPCKKGLRPVKSATCMCLCEPCPDDFVLCETSGACISEEFWCDGFEHCPDDEVSCEIIKPNITSKQDTSLIVKKTCPEPSCPVGFKVKISQTITEPKMSPMFQTPVTNVKTNLKTSYTKTSTKSRNTFDNSLALPTKGGVKSNYIVEDYCAQFVCIPDKPAYPGISEKLVVCQKPTCPEGYEVIMEVIKTNLPNQCAKYTCEPLPQNDGVCNVTGRIFNTFDGTEFKYDICSHVLARDLTADKWSVILKQNCTAGNFVCTKELEIKDKESDFIIIFYTDLTLLLDGYHYTIGQLQKSQNLKKAFTVSKVGNTIVLISNVHGFWVTFDQFGDVKIGVSSKYISTVDGLCGFYNDDARDDKRLPNGKPSISTVEFGDSWYIDDISKDNCKPHACPKDLQDAAWNMCTAVSHEVFAACKSVVDVERFITKCLETACECLQGYLGDTPINGSLSSLPQVKNCKCSMLQNFVVECMAANENIQLDTWRSLEQCETYCAAPLVHKDCYRRRCEPSCDSLSSDSCPFLPGTCFSGCYCPEGTVRKGAICAPVSECRDCVCDGFGKSQYVTYDRSNFTFNGNCTYLLSRDLRVNDVHTFQVYTSLGPCDSSSLPTKNIKKQNSGTCTKSLHILYGPHIIHIQKGTSHNLDVIIDGIKTKSLPFKERWIEVSEVQGRELRILLPESQVEITSLFEDMAFSIRVPSIKYGFKMEGLCGDCNKDPSDDFKPNVDKLEKIKKTDNPINDFVKSWMADEPKLELHEEECMTEEEAELDCIPLPPEDDPCLKMFDEDIFGKCHILVDPFMYVSACQQDMCKAGPEQLGACESISAYVRECSRNGLCIDWRKNGLCPYKCASNLTYSACGCPETCESVKTKENLSKNIAPTKTSSKLQAAVDICYVPKTEGCFCPKGKLLHNGKCIPERECKPCDKENHFPGDKWYPDKCTDCKCELDGTTLCNKKKCPVDEIICDRGSDPREITKPGECCPKFICVPIPTLPPAITCPDVIIPDCGPGQYKKMEMDLNNCPKYICECKPISDCKKVKIFPTPLEPGMKVFTDVSGCCPVSSLVCDKTLCPPKIKKCNDEFYEVIQILNKENKCCEEFKCVPPKEKCIVIIDGKKYLKTPGEKWTTKDPCLSKECAYDLKGVLLEKEIKKVCDVKCDIGFELQVPLGECCGKCIQVQCKIGNDVYLPGQVWFGADNCTKFTCTKKDQDYYISSTEEVCPDISDCPLARQYKKGCCTLCKFVAENKTNCAAEPLSPELTIGLVSKYKPGHGKCKNIKPVVGFTECRGTCASGSKFNSLTFEQDKHCDCCAVKAYKDLSVTLECEDKFTILLDIAVPSVCSCNPCEEKKMDSFTKTKSTKH